MLKSIFRFIYWLKLKKRYQTIDNVRYLKRLNRGANRADVQYFSHSDYGQYSHEEPVCVSTHYRGKHVLFSCNPHNHFERKIIKQGFDNHPVLDYMADYAQPNTIVLDIGANVGVYAVPLAAAFRDVTVHAFEPNSAVVDKLLENGCLNHLKNLVIHSCAVADSVGVRDFYQFDNDISLSSLNYHATEIHGKPVTHKIQTETIDHLFAGDSKQKIRFIKIDVQGSELECLRGAHSVIEKHLPVILFEHEDIHFETPAIAQDKKNAIAEILSKFGYKTFYLTRFNHRLLLPVNWKRPLNGDVIAIPMK